MKQEWQNTQGSERSERSFSEIGRGEGAGRVNGKPFQLEGQADVLVGLREIMQRGKAGK